MRGRYCNDPGECIPNGRSPFSPYFNGFKMLDPPPPLPPHFSGIFPLKRTKIVWRRLYRTNRLRFVSFCKVFYVPDHQ